MTRHTLRAAFEAGELVLAPGIYDMISGLIADQAGFRALYMTGYGVAASHLGLPDAGLAGYSDVLSRVQVMAERCTTPIIADADTGYGGLLNVRHTVRGYERAGAAGIQIEDQEFPKKCGHTDGRRVIPAEEMVRKIKVALEARTDDDMLIVARTDARTSLGIDEALRRAEAYAAAGADLIFLESPESEEELARVAKAIDRPLVANMVQGGRTPVLPTARLQELGYALAIHPGLGFLAAAEALRRGYAELSAKGTVTETPLHDFDAFCQTVGFQDIWDFDARWAEEDGAAGSRTAAE